MLRTGRPESKGLGFTLVIWCGYVCGFAAKLTLAFGDGQALPPVSWLYLLNSATVRAHAWLYYRYSRCKRALGPPEPAGRLQSPRHA
jgi:hypothetical protein